MPDLGWEPSGVHVDFDPPLPATIRSVTLHSGDGVVAAFQVLEDGTWVEVEPDDAVVGVVIDHERRARWLTIRDATD